MNTQNSLEQFIREHYASMKNLALRFVVSNDIAEDIVQEVIISYWENGANHDNISSIKNYLYTVVKNRCLDYLKKQRRELLRYEKIELCKYDNSIENTIIEQDVTQIIVNAIDCLPEKTANVIRLSLAGFTNKEIAFTTGVSINTVKTLKYAALRKIREYFMVNKKLESELY